MNITKIRSVCIIDDDPIFIYGTKRIMKEVDFSDEIIVYNNGQDAIEGLQQITDNGKELPSIIFLDLNMPIMNGWEFLDHFTEKPNNNQEDILIYIISSSVDPRDIARIQDYDIVNNYILKPITIEDLHKILKNTGGFN
ncbi:response regulator [Zobellia galactanivorans]|uniref:Two-component system-Response regulator, receiver domain n=1 Tax=Zobellia galactanivorans (strain DSM 12802 / CCUG 47099 / CIP 106680 / NCIMB 13871 / Dsij) TaxID=63186 RepID=G0LAP7_ZOBGA|nr:MULTISPECIES: response regulator [Zobellia]MDO6515883.1 response regulator [Zobellia uliginosa]MDO6808330.1 response regulator [Zobellia galactanivorans]CAZ95485.1 Two-component system-Response regulator, receiver domain [Zobellia galactanivorans]